MATESKSTDFGLGAVLGVSTGILMSEFGEMQEVVEHLCGGPVWTHELLSVAEPCREEVLRQRPDLAGVVVPDLSEIEDKWAFLKGWLVGQAQIYGDRITLTGGLGPMRTKGPVETLSDLIGADRVVVVDVDDES